MQSTTLLGDVAALMPDGQDEELILKGAASATKPSSALCSLAWRHAPEQVRFQCNELALADRARAQKDRASALALLRPETMTDQPL